MKKKTKILLAAYALAAITALSGWAAAQNAGLRFHRGDEAHISARAFEETVRAVDALSEALEAWDDESILNAMVKLAEEMGAKNAKVMWPVRIAAAGKAVTPGGAVEICRILGRDETLRRLRIAVEKLS